MGKEGNNGLSHFPVPLYRGSCMQYSSTSDCRQTCYLHSVVCKLEKVETLSKLATQVINNTSIHCIIALAR